MDPKLTKTQVVIRYESDDGFESEESFGSDHLPPSLQLPPEANLIHGLEELARLTALFGFEDHALAAFNGARERVAEWKKNRAEKGGAQ